MEKVLLVSHGEKNRDIFTQLLAECGLTEVYTAKNTVQARRLLAEYEFAVVLIVSPLSEEYGCEIAKTAAKTAAGVMLVVKKDHAEEMTEKMKREGVLCLPRVWERHFSVMPRRFCCRCMSVC